MASLHRDLVGKTSREVGPTGSQALDHLARSHPRYRTQPNIHGHDEFMRDSHLY